MLLASLSPRTGFAEDKPYVVLALSGGGVKGYAHIGVLEVLEREGVERAVCDYISGMTDGYAMEKYGELFIPFAWTVK